MRANFLFYEVDVHYECPECKLITRLRNDQIMKNEGRMSFDCSNCGTYCYCEPLEIIVEEKAKKIINSPVKNDKRNERNYTNVLRCLMEHGWKEWEAIERINLALSQEPNAIEEPGVLLKLALAPPKERKNDELAT